MRTHSPLSFQSGRRAIAICAAVATMAISAQAANYFRFNDILTSRYACTTEDGEQFCDVRFYKHLNAVIHLAWTTNEVDISTFDENTLISIENGDFGGVSFTLGEAGFRVGRRTVVYRFRNEDTERVVGSMIVTWNKRGVTFIASTRGTIAAESLLDFAEAGRVNVPITSTISVGDFQRTLTGAVRGSYAIRTITRNEEEISLPTIFVNGNLHIPPPEL